MRSVRSGSYLRLSTQQSLWEAWRLCRRCKRRTPAIAFFEIDCDRHLLGLERDLLAGTYRPSPYRLHVIRDPKLRLIAAPVVRDRILHHALLSEIGPAFEKRFIDQSFAAGKGRGPMRAALYFLRCQRQYKWRLHMDVSGYFLSIDHLRLQHLLSYRLHDVKTLNLVRLIVESGNLIYQSQLATEALGDRCPNRGSGLPLGSWFSQWCGNFYLDGLDHFIKRTLNIPGYLRYMDDFVLFANDHAQMLSAQLHIMDWLRENRQLTLNLKHQFIESTAMPTVFLGYRISRSGITASRKLRRRLRWRIRNAASHGEETLIRTIRSYQGLLLFP